MSEMYSIEQGVLICSTCMKYVCVINNLGENLVPKIQHQQCHAKEP